MKNYIADGNTMPFTAGATIASGGLVVVGDLAGVAITDVANGATGTLQLTGVVKLVKAAAANEIVAGAPCYHVAGEITHTDNSGANKLVGYAFATASAAATEITVRLKQ